MGDSHRSSSEVKSLITTLESFPYWGFLIVGGSTPNTSYVFLLSEFKRKEPQTTVDSREFSSWIAYWIRLINQKKRPGYVSFEDTQMWEDFAQKSLMEKDVSTIRLSYMTADQISEFKKKETISKLGEGKIAFEGNKYVGVTADRERATDTAPSGVSNGCGTTNGPTKKTITTEESEKVVMPEKGSTQKVEEVLVGQKQATGANTDTAPSGVSNGCGTTNGPTKKTITTEESEKVVMTEKGSTQKVEEVLVGQKQATGANTQKSIYLPTELVLGKEGDDLLDGTSNNSKMESTYEHVNPEDTNEKTSSAEIFDNLDEHGEIIDSFLSLPTTKTMMTDESEKVVMPEKGSTQKVEEVLVGQKQATGPNTDTAPSGVSNGCGTTNGPTKKTIMTDESEKVVMTEKGSTQKVEEVLVGQKQATGANGYGTNGPSTTTVMIGKNSKEKVVRPMENNGNFGGNGEGVQRWLVAKAPSFLAGAVFAVTIMKYIKG